MPTLPVHHLYVHIPFCPHICPYCAFHVLRADKALSSVFMTRLLEEYRSIHDELDLKTVFLGGGTPTALSIPQMELLTSEILGNLKSETIEVTAECNPSTLSPQKAHTMHSAGINRLSIGAQSMDPIILKTLGRTHSARAVQDCVETGRDAGITNINIDLIFGVPGQTLDSWKQTLHAALDLNPSHLSCYGLTYEEDTDFFRRLERGDCQQDSELELEMFRLADQILEDAGFHHYEISNYARPGFESLHNLSYWRGENYHGIGPSAVSTVRGIRRRNSKLTSSVLEVDALSSPSHPNSGDGASPSKTQKVWNVEEEESLSQEILASERMTLGLRTSEGVEETDFQKRFGFLPSKKWGKEIDQLIQNQLLIRDPVLKLTSRGREVADEIATCFV